MIDVPSPLYDQEAKNILHIPTKTYLFDCNASKIQADLRDCFHAIVDFLQTRGVPTQELDRLIEGQYYIVALERAQSYTQCLKRDRQEAAKLIVSAAEHLCRHTAIHYRNSCKGIQQLRSLHIGEEEMKREKSIHIELGEQCVASQKRLVYIQAWQRRLCCRRATM
jgi:hypothetical protein